MRLSGVKTVQRALRQVRSRLFGGVVVLGYHRVGGGPDPFGLIVSPRHFADQIEFIARYTTPVRLTEASRRPQQLGTARARVVVTFDDGYLDTWKEALPVLERWEVPATVFIATGNPGLPFWWDELTHIMMGQDSLPPALEINVEGRRRAWQLGSEPMSRGPDSMNRRRRVLLDIADVVRPTVGHQRDDLMRHIRAWAGAGDGGGAVPRALTADEVRQLAASPTIDIGGHSVSHPMLPAVSVIDQRREIRQCRDYLVGITGQPIPSFSYPHGAYSRDTRRVVAEAGFTMACCSTPDALTPWSDPLTTPRLWAADQDGDSFERWLRPWICR